MSTMRERMAGATPKAAVTPAAPPRERLVMSRANSPVSAEAEARSAFGMRLRAARKRAGLSMEELAGRMGGAVTKQAIGKYETGRMMPVADVLERLAAALGPGLGSGSGSGYGFAGAGKAGKEGAGQVGTRGEGAGSAGARKTGLGQSAAGKAGAGRPGVGHDAASWRVDDGNQAYAHGDAHAPASSPRAGYNGNLPADDGDGAFGRRPEDLSAPSPRRARLRVPAALAFPVPLSPSLPLALAQSLQLPDSENIRFRDGRKLSAKAGSTMRYRMADQLERCLKLESLLGETVAAYENPLGGNAAPPANAEEVEAAAIEVRRRWDLGSGPVVNLLGCLEDKGIRVFETSGLERFDGLSGALGPVPFIVVSRDFPADRRRFTAAHELGHVLCGFPDRDGAEAMCHAFAGAFLLPRAALERAFGGTARRKITLGDLTELKLTYGVSLQAIMHRAKDAGLVGARQFRLFREMVRARGWHETEPVEFVGMERATRFMRLVRSAVASGIMSIEQAAELSGVPAERIRDEMGEMF